MKPGVARLRRGDRTRVVVLCGTIPLVIAALLSVARPRQLMNLEYGVYDTLVRAASTRRPDDRVAIVDVDERSLSAIGQWPWRRDLVGALIAQLRDLGASAVAIDIVFAEPDRYTGAGASTDEELADTLRGGGVVLGYGLRFDESAPPGACVRHPIGVAVVRRGEAEEEPYFRASGAVCNLPLLTEAAGASGFLNAAPDPDGLLRRVPLLVELGGRVYPSLALAAVTSATRARDVALRVANVNASILEVGSRRVPLDGKGNLLLRYRGPKKTFPYFSAVDVLDDRLPAGTFAGKLVFVGTTALGTREVVSTPLDTLFTGVEVQATVADNLLQQDFMRRPEHAATIETGAVVAAGIVAILTVGRFGIPWGAAAGAACLALAWTGAVWLLSTRGTLLSPLFPTAGLVGAVAAMTVAGLAAERRRADRAGEERATSQRLMIETLLSLTEIRDAETGRHSRRIEEFTRVLATELARHPAFRDDLTPERIELLAALGPLHDIGKVGVADELLHKAGPLTEAEMLEMRRHPEYGRDVIAKAEREAGVRDDATLAIAKEIVYTHHEWWDGSGYPQGLRGRAIPVAGRVVALVDVYDALRSSRPYSRPKSHDEALAAIVAKSGTHFDPAVVGAFVRVSEALRRVSDAGR